MQSPQSADDIQLDFPRSFPKSVLPGSPSCNSSSVWSLASVPYSNPDSSWDFQSEEQCGGDEIEVPSWGESEEKEEDVSSPQPEQLEIGLSDSLDDDYTVSFVESMDTANTNSSPSSESSASSVHSHVEENDSESTCHNGSSWDIPSSPAVYRMVSERAQLSRLGFEYRYGCGPFPQNLFKSSQFYKEAGELGCADALSALAVAHIFELGVPRSLEEGRLTLRNALLKGSVDALEVRALCFMTGTFDNRRNYNSCLQLLTMGVARNSSACLLWAGLCSEVGLGMQPDPYAAKDAYLAAGESTSLKNLVTQMLPGVRSSRDPWALMKVALFMLHSNHDSSQQQPAMDCLKGAARLGFQEAQLYLAICLIQGKWLQQDGNEALYWLTKAMSSDESHPLAERILRQVDGLGRA